MKNSFLKWLMLLSLSAMIGACNSGGSSSGTPNNINQASDEQIKEYAIDANQSLQYATPYVEISNSTNENLNQSKISSLNTTNTCLTASGLTFDSSSSVWHISGKYIINNICTTAQQIQGTIVVLTGGMSSDLWTGGEFSIYSYQPWLGNVPSNTIKTNGNKLFLTMNNSYLLAGGQKITANFGYSANNKPLTKSGATVAIGDSVAPPPPAKATLNIVVSSSSLSNTCNTTKPCNIQVNLVNATTNALYKTITTITTSVDSNTYTFSDLIPGDYKLVANSLPTNAQINYIPLSGNLTLTAGQVTQASANFSVTNPSNACLSASTSNLSRSAWWVSGSINLVNTCNVTQLLSGTTIAISSSDSTDMIGSFQVNSTQPYFADFATITGTSNSSLLTVKANSSLTANSTMVINFGYSPQGGNLKGTLIASVNGATPLANASLTVIVDSTGLNTYCTSSQPCNIPVNLSGGLTQNITTIGSVTGKNIYKFSNLNPGLYTVSTSNLPASLLAVYTPSASIQIASNESASITLALNVKPVTTGILNFSLMNPASNLFKMESLPVTIQSVDGSTSVAVNAKFAQQVNTSLNANNYNISTIGLASASQGIYYSYPILAKTIIANQTVNLGNIVAQSESNIITEPIVITGLKTGDNVVLVFTDNKHMYNSEVITGIHESTPVTTPLKFINGSIITINVITNSNYQMVAPATITIQAGQTYTIPLVEVKSPNQQIVGYYETWMGTATWESATYSLAKIPPYVNIIPIAFAKPDSQYVGGSYKFSDAGLGISATPSVAVGAIKIAQAKGQKLLLSVGGATYPNFGAFNLQATLDLVADLGLDGVDFDYEGDPNYCTNLNSVSLTCSTDTQIINIITQLRNGLDQLQVRFNKKMYLTAAVWSIGAYGTTSFPSTGAPAGNGVTRYGPYGSRAGMWVNPLKQIGNKFDAIFLMSYDAGNVSSTGYAPLDALKSYKAIYNGPIYLGVEVPPEAWGGNLTTPAQAVNNAQAAMALGASGTMIWALQVQGNDGTKNVNSNSYLQPICALYNPLTQSSYCSGVIPLN